MAETTTIQDLVNPQVMADMISAKITSKIVVTPFAKVDTTLQGVPGDTITVPQYSYIGDAVDVAEGVKADTVKLQTSTTTVKIKKAMKAVELTDESVLSGYGNPVAETNNQIGKSIAAKVDADAMAALQGAQLTYDGSAAAIKYAGIVDAIDVLDEEVNTDKVIFVHPKQVTQLRKDNDFLSADKYKNGVSQTVIPAHLPEAKLDEVKTKAMKTFLDAIQATKSVVITPEVDEIVVKSARNIPGVVTTTAKVLSVYDIVTAKRLVVDKAALAIIEEVFA